MHRISVLLHRHHAFAFACRCDGCARIAVFIIRERRSRLLPVVELRCHVHRRAAHGRAVADEPRAGNRHREHARAAALSRSREGPGPGARALYLGDTMYRIHGSNEPHTIGTAAMSGCIRLTNDDVIDLYNRVKIGATVVVR